VRDGFRVVATRGAISWAGWGRRSSLASNLGRCVRALHPIGRDVDRERSKKRGGWAGAALSSARLGPTLSFLQDPRHPQAAVQRNAVAAWPSAGESFPMRRRLVAGLQHGAG